MADNSYDSEEDRPLAELRSRSGSAAAQLNQPEPDPELNRNGTTAEHHVETSNQPQREGENGMMLALRESIQQNSRMLDMLQNQWLQRTTATNAGTFEPVTNFSVMPDLSKTIRPFNGELLNEASGWLKTLESTAMLHKWPDAFTFETARINLEGAARHWFYSRRDEIENWQQFKDAFRKTFVHEESLTTMWKSMATKIQGPKESLHSYFHEKAKMCRCLKLSFTETKEQIVIGLFSRELASMVLTRSQVNEDELYKDIVSFERIVAERKGHRSDNSSAPRGKGATFTLHSPTSGVKTELQNDVKCYNCLSVGHYASKCPQPKALLCFLCKEKGHKREACPKAVQQDVKVKSGGQQKPMLKISSEDDTRIERFLKDVELNDQLILKAFIDMGSAICTIKASAVINHNLSYQRDNDINIYGFGSDQPVLTSKNVVRAKLHIDEASVDGIKFYVVPDNAQNMDIIVGRPFTENNNVAYTRINNRLIFTRNDDFPFKDLNTNISESDTDTVRLLVAEDVLIQPNTVALIKTSVNNHVVGVVNSSDKVTTLKNGDEIARVSNSCVSTLRTSAASAEMLIPRNLVNIDSDISAEDSERLMTLLDSYRDCFALSVDELGCTDLIEMNIEDSGVPVRAKPYKTSAGERERIKEIVSEWKRVGIATETTSPYASPVLLVPKKTGESRLVVDYRRLNQQTIKRVYPTRNIDDQLEALSDGKLFTTLDLAQGYLQVPLSESAREKTAFITPDETGEFTRMVFGLLGSPYEFSRLMYLTMKDLAKGTATWYLDDVLVSSRDWDEMLDKLKCVFDAIRMAKLTFKLEKCEFGKREVDFLGYVLSEGCIQPGSRKVKAIREFRRPENVHQVRQFIGLTNFFRRFVKDYARIARPLSDLTRKSARFVWGADQERAFRELQEKLCAEPVLKLYDPKAKTQLHTDASADGLAGMLLQQGEGQKWHLVYCVSKKTSETERNYHSSKLELMAIVWSVQRLRAFLLEIEFEIITDCQALVYMNTKKTLDPQIARWFNLLSEFTFEIHHRGGDKMSHIDALSRAPVENSDNWDFSERVGIFVTISDYDRILMIQRSDVKLNRIINILQSALRDRNREEQNLCKDYVLENGRLLRIVHVNKKQKHLYVIPDSMRKSIVIKHHNYGGHFSVDRTVSAILKRYWFKGMRRYVRKHIRACFECLMLKVPGGKKPGLLHPIPIPKRPFSRVHIDHVGPFITSKKGNTHVLVMICGLIKFVRLYCVKTTGVKPVLKALDSFILEHGLMNQIVSDRGAAFTSKAFEEYCVNRGIHHTLNSSRHPQANGQVERVNRCLVPVILANMNEECQWDKDIKLVESQMNNAENQSTEKTPFECLYGYVPEYDSLVVRNVVSSEEYTPPHELRNEIMKNLERSQHQYKSRTDRKRFLGILYRVGDLVVMKRAPEYTGQPTKTQCKYRGPLVVTECLPSDTYRVSSVREADGGRIYETTAHVSQLKIYRNHEHSDDDDEEPTSEEGNSVKSSDDDSATEAEHKVEEAPVLGKRRSKQPVHLRDFVLQ